MPKILIVDDESHIRLLLKQTLEELEEKGVVLLNAENGAKALDIIKNEMPDLVFLDIMMPELNGFDVAYKVKKELGLSNIYIIMLTARGMDFDKRKGKECGADDYITKPFDPDELLEKAKKVLNL